MFVSQILHCFVPKPNISFTSSSDGESFKKLMRHCIDRQACGLRNRWNDPPRSENTRFRWDLNSDEHKNIFFPLVKSGFKRCLPVTKETTLGKSMNVMSVEREGIPQHSPPPPKQSLSHCVCVFVCVCVWPTISLSPSLSLSLSQLRFLPRSHFLCHLPLILSLAHSLSPPHNTCFLTTTAKGLAGAAHPKFPSLGGGLEEEKREETKGEKKTLQLYPRCCDSLGAPCCRPVAPAAWPPPGDKSGVTDFSQVRILDLDRSGSEWGSLLSRAKVGEIAQVGRSWTGLALVAGARPGPARPDLALCSSARRWQTAVSQDVESGWFGDDRCAGGHGSLHQSPGAVWDVWACRRGR